MNGYCQDISGFLNHCDIFTYLSYIDNAPIAILEAMSFGIPIVSNRVGAVPKILQQGEYGFCASNKQEYSSYLSLLIRSRQLRREMGQKAFVRAHDFHINKVASQFCELYVDFLISR